jgi:FkbM family methyltransferase
MLIPFNELFTRHNVKAGGVLHLGASIGQEAAAYSQQGIDNVVWVEAHPTIHAQLQREVAKYPKHVALLGCIGETDGNNVIFHVANNGGQSSSILEFGTHSKEHPTVRYIGHLNMKTVRVDTLLRENHVLVGPNWFLNIDLQGAELLALKSMGELLYQFNYAYIEVNERHLYAQCPLVGEIDAYLRQFGFTGREVKMTKSGWGDKFYVRDH